MVSSVKRLDQHSSIAPRLETDDCGTVCSPWAADRDNKLMNCMPGIVRSVSGCSLVPGKTPSWWSCAWEEGPPDIAHGVMRQ